MGSSLSLAELGLRCISLDCQALQAEGMAVAGDQGVPLSPHELCGVPVHLVAAFEVVFPAVDAGVFGVAVER